MFAATFQEFGLTTTGPGVPSVADVAARTDVLVGWVLLNALVVPGFAFTRRRRGMA